MIRCKALRSHPVMCPAAIGGRLAPSGLPLRLPMIFAARRGDISPQGVYRLHDGSLEVRYLSRIPQQWQREELGKIAAQN